MDGHNDVQARIASSRERLDASTECMLLMIQAREHAELWVWVAVIVNNYTLPRVYGMGISMQGQQCNSYSGVTSAVMRYGRLGASAGQVWFG
jgi:hypothetical protein